MQSPTHGTPFIGRKDAAAAPPTPHAGADHAQPSVEGGAVEVLAALGPHSFASALTHRHDHHLPPHGLHYAPAAGTAPRSRAQSATTGAGTVDDSVSLLTHPTAAVNRGDVLVPGPPFDADAFLTQARKARVPADDVKKLNGDKRDYFDAMNTLIEFYEAAEEMRANDAAQAEAELKRAASASARGTTAAADTKTVVVLVPGEQSDASGMDAATAAPSNAAAGVVGAPSAGSTAGASPAPSALGIAAEKAAEAERGARLASYAINASFGANVCLLAIKVLAATSGNSLAVIASLIDSVMDLISGGVVWLSAWLASRRNPYLFPIGKSRYEPISIIVFAALMGAASLQLISQGVTSLTDGFGAKGAPPVESGPRVWGTLIAIIGVKATLYLVCSALRKYSSSVGALALDHFNDVLTNAGPLIAVLVSASYPSWWWLDPVAAILMSCYMVWMWIDAAKAQIALITGQAATPREISEITYLALTHSPSIIAVDTVLAYQLGNKLQVEVDIVLPRDMPLCETHDIGEGLQKKVERLQNVERCFVHLDYDWRDHKKDDEHANPYDQPAYAPPED